MYKVLDKDIIENEILTHLSMAKRGWQSQPPKSNTPNPKFQIVFVLLHFI